MDGFFTAYSTLHAPVARARVSLFSGIALHSHRTYSVRRFNNLNRTPA